MTDNGKVQEDDETVEDRRKEPIVLTRHYAGLGRGIDNLRVSLHNLTTQGQYVYQLQIRWPRPGKPSHSLLVKMLDPDGAHIAFHSDFGWQPTLLGFGARMRAGGLDWMNDDYPPDNWSEVLAYLVKEGYEPS